MKNSVLKTFIALSLLLHLTITFGQYSTKSKKAIKLYEKAEEQIKNRQFDEGLYNLEMALRTDAEFTEARYLFARTHSFMNFNKDSDDLVKKHYEIIAEQKPNDASYAEVYFRLMNFELYDKEFIKAQVYLDKLKDLGTLTYGESLNESQRLITSALEAEKGSVTIDLVKLPETINLGAVQYRPVLTADEELLVFTAKVGNQEDVFMTKKQNGIWGEATEFIEGLNSKYNEGFVTISADGNVMVYASTEPHGFGKSDLYVAYKKGGKWTVPKNMGRKVNSNGYDSEPTLTADGQAMYYSTARDGGMGQKDIWYSERDSLGEWKEAVNLGASINTVGNEVTPFIHADKKFLYFASDGRDGLGGYDVYYAARTSDLSFENAVNVGYPINTEKDEGAMFILPDYSKAFMDIYNYQGRYSTCFIYEFEFPENLKAKHKCTYAKGLVFDVETDRVLEAQVRLIDLETSEIVQEVHSSSETGEFLVVLNEDKPYALQISTDGYLFYSKSIDFSLAHHSAIEIKAGLVPIDGTNKSIVLENIYFEARKYVLLDASKVELTELVKLLIDNPTLKIRVEGHTDNVGGETYNLDLSDKRAKSVVAYLLLNGVNKNQLSSKGYGSATPRAINDTDLGRGQNRRIEIKIL
jgi:OOP family OmpA-OmpF porin